LPGSTLRTCSTKAVLWRWSLVLGKKDGFLGGGNFLHADGLAQGFEESELTKHALPKTNMAMDNSIFNRKHIFKSRDFRCHVSFRGGNPTKQQRLFQLFHQNKIDSTKRKKQTW